MASSRRNTLESTNTKMPRTAHTSRNRREAFTKKQQGIMRNYNRMLKKEQRNLSDPAQSNRINQSIVENNNRMKMSAYDKAKAQYERLAAEKQKRKEEKEVQNQERREALKLYRRKRAEKFKKLSQKTRKGQPVMKGRIELLLDKIQRSVANDTVQR